MYLHKDGVLASCSEDFKDNADDEQKQFARRYPLGDGWRGLKTKHNSLVFVSPELRVYFGIQKAQNARTH